MIKHIVFLTVFVAFPLCSALAVTPLSCPNAQQILLLLKSGTPEQLKPCAETSLSLMVRLYPKSDEDTKARIADALYMLGLKSEDARAVLMEDVHTQNSRLRLAVQWALGRVSNDDVVVKTLLDNMQNDPNPLFRDKAACALASDQIHLTEKQRVELYNGLIGALDDEKDDVRRIAGLALQIHTGQTRGYNSSASLHKRAEAIESWRTWLNEYRAQIEGTK